MSPNKNPQPTHIQDFSGVDSQEKAVESFHRGELEKLFVMPLEFGGEDILLNTLYVPVGIAAVKAEIDNDVIGPLVQEGEITQYKATPEYQGKSFVPSALTIVASEPGELTVTIPIWGDALTRDGAVPFETLLTQSMEELRMKTDGHDAGWGLGKAAWSVDQEQGEIVFTRDDGVKAIAPVQIIGTYNTKDGTWLWGWDHPSVQPALQEHARRVHEYGKKKGIARLLIRKLACSELEAWEFVALACKLCEAQGAYRGPAGVALVYMTFGNVKLSK